MPRSQNRDRSEGRSGPSFGYRVGGGVPLWDTPSFSLPLNDAGAGAVNTAVSFSSGSGTPTFTRATAAAARLGVRHSDGISWKWKLDVASGTARSHYLADGTYGGYLAEGAATQILTAPRDVTNVAWVKTNMTTAQTSNGLDDAVNSCTRCTSALANATALQTITAAATDRTFSLWVKRITGTGNFDLTQDGVTFTTVTVTSAFTQVSLDATQLNAIIGFRIVTNGDAFDIDCAQFESGAFATTPIPAAGTRNVDTLTYATAGNASGILGSAYAEVTSASAGTSISRTILNTYNGGVDGSMLNFINSTLAIYDGVLSYTLVGSLTFPMTSVTKVASRWNNTVAQGFVRGTSGAAVVTDGNLSFTASMGIGITPNAVAALYGTAKNVRIWLQDVGSASGQAMTA